MGKQRTVEVRNPTGLPVGAKFSPQTLATVAIAPIPADQPPVLIAGYDSKDGSLRIANLRTWVEAMAQAEKVHMVGKLDTRDAITVTMPALSLVGTPLTAELEVDAGDVWYLNMVQLVSPAESGVGVGDILQVNFRISSWPDAVSAAGQLFFPANQGTAAVNNYYAEFHPYAPFFGVENLSEPLRLVGGDKLTLVTILTGVNAGAALVAQLIPFGWKGRYLVD